MYNTRSRDTITDSLSRINVPLREYFNKLNSANTNEERCKYVHKIYIIVNANKEIIMNEKKMAVAVYKCALRNRIKIIDYRRKTKTIIYSQKQMEHFIEYFETYCLKNSQITCELFRHIISFL